MTTRNPVIWSEGQFVKPQHFQQTDRYLEHYINVRLGSKYWYGFADLELNQEFLSFGKIAVVRARGIMPDGTAFNIPHDQPPPEPLSILDATAANQTVYLDAFRHPAYAQRAQEVVALLQDTTLTPDARASRALNLLMTEGH